MRRERTPEPVDDAASVYLRCEVCRRPAEHPVHSPVHGAGFFGTLLDDPASPWQAHWPAGHHRFVVPPVSTATRLTGTLVDLDLDVPPLGAAPSADRWTHADVADLQELTAGFLPPESDVVAEPDSAMAAPTRPRVVVWLLILAVVGSLTPLAHATTQADITPLQQQLDDLERERLDLASEELRLAEELAAAEVLADRLARRRDETDRATESVSDGRDRIAALAAIDPSRFLDPWTAVLAAGGVPDAPAAAVYTEIALTEQIEAVDALTARAQGVDAAARSASATVSRLAGDLRDLRVRLDALDRRIIAAHERVTVVTREAGETLGLGPQVERWRPLVAEYFPEDLVDDALWVMWCESRGDPEARAWPRSSAVGLFQFIVSTWRWLEPRAGVQGADRTDPEASIAAAAWLVEFSRRTHHPQGIWGPWSCRP